jgi:hypothetical protein
LSDQPRFQSEPDSATLVNVTDAIAALRHENGLQFMRWPSVTALQLMVVAVTMFEFLVVFSGEPVVAYHWETLEEVAWTRVPQSTIQLTSCAIDPALFTLAFASLHQLIVYSVSEAGFSQAHEIKLMPDSLGRHIFVNSVEWILSQLLHLVVVCNAFVKSTTSQSMSSARI